MSPPERVVVGGQGITWEWLKFIKWVLFLSEMSFYLALGSGLGDIWNTIVSSASNLFWFAWFLGITGTVTIVPIFEVLGIS